MSPETEGGKKQESISTGRRMSVRRIRTAFMAMLLILAALVAWTQASPQQELEHQAERQQTRAVYVPAKRGILADRHGTALNYTLPCYAVVIRPELVRDPRDTMRVTADKLEQVISELASGLGPDFYAARPDRKTIEAHLRRNAPMALALWQELDSETIGRWNALHSRFPSTELQLSWKRHYLYPEAATHLRGMTRLDVPADPDMKQYWNSNFMEPVGVDGLEQALNARLRGEGGYELLQTDVLSYRQTVLDSRLAVNGEDIAMTIDLQAQMFAEKLFEDNGYSGALVILDSRTAETLVMCSWPGGNLQNPSTARPTGSYNRCLAGYYPPGSTLKPFVALCALERGAIDAETEIDCRGSFEVSKEFRQACSSKYGHQRLNLPQALACSCNVFFCETARMLGAAGMDMLPQRFVFGRNLNTALWRQEIQGIAFTPQWVEKNRKNASRWSVFDSANAAIGQGSWIVTPMQLAVNVNAIATGKLVRPKLTMEEDDAVMDICGWSEEMRRLVLEGMRLCVEEPRGTGKALRIPGVQMYGKTGTAETGTGKPPHALCIAIAATEDTPRLVGVCVVEHIGGGGKYAAPLLRQVLQKLLDETP